MNFQDGMNFASLSKLIITTENENLFKYEKHYR